MLKNLALLISTILILIQVGPVSAFSGKPQVLAFLSANVSPYEKALNGFRMTCDCAVRKIVLSEIDPYFDVSNEIEATRPDLLLAVGPEALARLKTKAKNIRDLPIVYMMVLDPEPLISVRKNITGVRMTTSPDKQLTSFLRAIPIIRKVGVVYNPARSEEFVAGAMAAAAKAGINLVIKKAEKPEDIPNLVNEMAGKIDAFWMIPDASVVTSDSLEAILLFSMENMVPVLTFSEKHLEIGALMSMSVSINAAGIGRQAGKMAEKVLRHGTDIALAGAVYAEDGTLIINELVAHNLNIYIASDLQKYKPGTDRVKGE